MITKSKTSRSRKRKTSHDLAEKVLNSTKKIPMTQVVLLLDNSGSMSSHIDGVKSALPKLMQPILETDDQDISVSIYTFGDKLASIALNESRGNLSSLITNVSSLYHPNEGSTDLYGSLNNAILNCLKSNRTDESYLFIIITDGEDNVRKISPSELSKTIRDVHATDRWSFVVSCPIGHSRKITNIGIPVGNIKEWDTNDSNGMEEVSRTNSVGLSNYFSARSAGKTNTKSFFAEVNVGRSGVRSVTSGLILEDKSHFRKLKVDKATNIKDFIESKGLKFEPGRSFYSLSKPETVQSYKKILLQKRKDSKIYGGLSVRDKLNIPAGGDGRVVPGNLGEWIIWIQSTSSNRKLLAGMELLYDVQNI